MRAEIKRENGAVRLFIDRKAVAPDAYITYVTPKACYEDFAAAGYSLFSLPVFFSSKTINENAQYPAFSYGLFDADKPKWDLLDEDFRKIVRACPNACIFPRVNVSLSEAWERANPDELNDKGVVELHRPCFSSDKWAAECTRLLGLFIDHVKQSDYAENVVGYQIAAGNTEEWLSHDGNASIGLRSREKYAEWIAQTHLPDTEENYYDFLSEIVAKRICDFAAFVKEKAGSHSIVGSFYGYALQFCSRLSCHNALSTVLNCKDVDFLCSPVSYEKGRSLGRDHSSMVPWSSIAKHGKLYFAENDTRTHLSRSPFPDNPYFDQPVFAARTKRDAIEMLKMHYSRAMIYGYAHWWFDMFGGWFHDDEYMALLKKLRDVSVCSLSKDLGSVAEIAVLIDEKTSNAVSDYDLMYKFCANTRDCFGNIGAPVDCFLACDYDDVFDKYKAIILIEVAPSELSERIKAKAKQKGIGVFVIGPNNYDEDPAVIRQFCRSNGAHVYCDDAVVYANQSYLFVHACKDGYLNINMPNGKALSPIIGSAPNSFVEKGTGILFEIV